MNRLSFAALCLAALNCAGALAQPAELPDEAAFKPGDRWVWREVDNRSRQELGTVSQTVVVDGDRKTMVLSDGRSVPVRAVLVGMPSDKPWRIWPLVPGAVWSHDTTWPRAEGGTSRVRQDAKVVGWEEVVVPAGRFNALRIEYDGFVLTSGGWYGRITETYWYAPSARADVKLMRKVGNNDFTRELVSFTPAAP